MEHTILTEVEAKITYDNYNKLKRFISKYYKTPAASFEQGEVDKLKVPTTSIGRHLKSGKIYKGYRFYYLQEYLKLQQ